MLTRTACLLAASTLTGLGPASALAAGFSFVEVPAGDDGAPAIEAAVWYPTEAAAPEAANTPFGQALALRGPVAGEALPLVVLSHGDGGWFGGHATLARELARAGMVAVAPNHPGNSDGDETATPGQWIAERPAHLRRLVAHMTGDWEAADRLDPDRIGLFGFSAGGHSVLVAAGARPSLAAMAAHCAADPQEFACAAGMVADVLDHAPRFPAGLSGLRAVVAVAPGFGFGFDDAGLAPVRVPVQLWAGEDDDRVSLAGNVAHLPDGLGGETELRRVAGAGHFAFLQPCTPALQAANPDLWEMVCRDAPGFDRAAFQQRFNAEVVAFLARHLID